MLFVLSPAKTLDFTPAPPEAPASRRTMTADTAQLAKVMRKLTVADLQRLMDISDKLAELNRARFKAFDPKDLDGGVQAALAFAGDVYDGLDGRNLEPADLDWAQDRLRILSGLYGLLRPLDRIQPYRLEMGTRLANPRGATLYDFWGDRISKALNKAAEDHADRTLVNLASQEYFGAVDARALKLPVTTCQFKEEKDGMVRILAFYAKHARGLMARFAIQNRLERADDLRAFDLGGYSFSRSLSSEGEWVFVRPQPLPFPSPPEPPDMMIDELVSRAAERTGLSEDQTRLGLKSALGLIQKHGEGDKVAALFEAIPGASTLATAGLQTISDGKRSGLMAAMMRGAGGEAGAAMSDAMAAGQTLARAGVTTSDMQSILPMAREFVREKTGQDLLSEVLASLPGIGKLLLG